MEGSVLLRTRSFDRQARAALRPGATFRVHSVFERALNLRLAGDLLLGLVGPRGGNGPATVVVQAVPPRGFQSLVAPGQEARVTASAVLAIGPALAVDFAQAALWQPPALRLPLAPALVRRNVQHAADLAWQTRGADGLGGLLPHLDRLGDPRAGPPWPDSDSPADRRAGPPLPGPDSLADPRAGPPLPGLDRPVDPPAEPPLTAPLTRLAGSAARSLLAAWRAGEATAAGQAAARLIGLGPGQTPAGDDLLAGFFVARLRSRPADRREAGLVAACLAGAPGRTTDLALARLRFAAQGELDERSLEALAALAGDDRPRLERAVRALLGFGHSSGLDTLVGLLLGLGVDRCPPILKEIASR